MSEQSNTFVTSLWQLGKTLAISLLLVGCGAVVTFGVMSYTYEREQRIEAEAELEQLKVSRTILKVNEEMLLAEQEELKALPLKQ